MRWQTIREFLRGGYQRVDEVTVVTRGGRPLFTVIPGTDIRAEPEQPKAKRETSSR